jgi:hypothetical protein
VGSIKSIFKLFFVAKYQTAFLIMGMPDDLKSLIAWLKSDRQTVARPAGYDGLPVAAPAPTAEQRAALAAACLANGVELVGPPLSAAPAAA